MTPARLIKSSGEVISSTGGLPRHVGGPRGLEIQLRGVMGPRCVEMTFRTGVKMGLANWESMVVKGRLSGKES